MFTRRAFIRNSGLTMMGFSALPSFLTRAVAASTNGGRKMLVVLFQRGAADGLNIVVPFGEKDYYSMRPTLAIPEPSEGSAEAALDLDGCFGLHPALAPVLPLFKSEQVAIIHAAGSPDTTRSQLYAPEHMESDTPAR